ncbi:hypothetical protein L228DRAFT_250283 [Xylona heveae TC161]|uniref:Peroxisomal membrane protein PEX14 n=1 Tax=Xylona heveae (strain CBS 132557 / TC161) TaxID=1328760 RepID=A0A165A2D9_XYLHT|nr:hypothetical protein L228DRAFT_250283 [Xylona heveae TC161]KZF19858.1 hypothetical protein L228DRAFT_250283 [Xylona heveae TC161]
MTDSSDQKKSSQEGDREKTDIISDSASSTERSDNNAPDADEPAQPKQHNAAHSEYTLQLETAAEFLKDDEIRNAPDSLKRKFLSAKNIKSEDIETLLRDAPKADPPSPTSADNVSENQSRSDIRPSSTKPSESPPVVTYPEFLVQASKPPPLVTLSRLATTLYISGAAALATYGANKYILSPMFNSLTSARHSLASTAQTNVDTLNEKLSGLVSEIPPLAAVKFVKSEEGETDGPQHLDTESEEPTELFHRDFGTQTSRRQSNSLSAHPVPGLFPPGVTTSGVPDSTSDPTTSQQLRIEALQGHLNEMVSFHELDAETNSEVTTSMRDLSTYLDGLTYSSAYWSSSGSYLGSVSGAGLGGVGSAKNDDDGITKFRNEIRSVKGVLLSARNFPTGPGRVTPSSFAR